VADFDYALLAEFARLEPTGLVTAVGAGYSQLAGELPARANLYVVARLLLDADDDEVHVRGEVGLRGEAATVTIEAVVTKPQQGAVTVDGRTPIAMVMVLPATFPTAGVCEVVLTVEGTDRQRRLPFLVADRSEA